MVHPAAPTPPNDGVSLTGPRRTAPTHLLVLPRAPPTHLDAHPEPVHSPLSLPSAASMTGMRTLPVQQA